MVDKVLYRANPAQETRSATLALLGPSPEKNMHCLSQLKHDLLAEVESSLYLEQSEFTYHTMRDIEDATHIPIQQCLRDFAAPQQNPARYCGAVAGKYSGRILSTLCFEPYEPAMLDTLAHTAIAELTQSCTPQEGSILSLRNFHIPPELFRSHYLKKLMAFTAHALRQQGAKNLVVHSSLLEAMHFRAVCQQLLFHCQMIHLYQNEAADTLLQRDASIMLIFLA